MKRLAVTALIFFSLICGLGAQGVKGIQLAATPARAATGNTYALIIGISKYESFPSLQFADKDAIAFYNFLTSPAGGGLDSSHIVLLTNEKARAGDIWRSISWLQKNAVHTGDVVYIYFSGHGDAADARRAYLLAYDALNAGDAHLYNAGGTVQIYDLKEDISDLTTKDVKVFLITDACRSNELPGKLDGRKWTLDKIMESQKGEIQMTSCASNELSEEGPMWGSGRGVFSYFLINGMQGRADEDANHEVTFYELQKYVKDNVKRETKSISTGKPRQNPVFCCSENDNDVISTVDPAKAPLLSDAALSASGALAYLPGKGRISNDTVVQQLYDRFRAAIDSNRLLRPQDASAYQYYQLLQARIADNQLKNNITDEMAACLNNSVQGGINAYINNKKIDAAYQLNQLSVLEELLSDKNALVAQMRPMKIFFYTLTLKDEMNVGDADRKLQLLDSAIALKPDAAYLHLFKGKYLLYIKKGQAAAEELRQAYTLAPNWLLALSGYAIALSDIKSDSAIHYLMKAYAIDSTNSSVLNGLMVVYRNMGQYDRSIFYARKRLQRDATNGKIYYSVAVAYEHLDKPDSAYYYFQRAYYYDSSSADLMRIANLEYTYKKDTVRALKLLQQCLRIDPKNDAVHEKLVNVYYGEGKTDLALREAEEVFTIRQQMHKAYNDTDDFSEPGLSNFKKSDEFKALVKKYSAVKSE